MKLENLRFGGQVVVPEDLSAYALSADVDSALSLKADVSSLVQALSAAGLDSSTQLSDVTFESVVTFVREIAVALRPVQA